MGDYYKGLLGENTRSLDYSSYGSWGQQGYKLMI